jgi:hypothetical protein
MCQSHMSRQWLLPRLAPVLAAVYVLSITLTATIGILSESHRILLVVAAGMSLPCGLGSLVGLYVFTGLFNWVAAGFTTSSTGSGGCDPNSHCWTSTRNTPVGAHGALFDTCIVLLYLAAAIGNVLILRKQIDRHSSRASLK